MAFLPKGYWKWQNPGKLGSDPDLSWLREKGTILRFYFQVSFNHIMSYIFVCCSPDRSKWLSFSSLEMLSEGTRWNLFPLSTRRHSERSSPVKASEGTECSRLWLTSRLQAPEYQDYSITGASARGKEWLSQASGVDQVWSPSIGNIIIVQHVIIVQRLKFLVWKAMPNSFQNWPKNYWNGCRLQYSFGTQIFVQTKVTKIGSPVQWCR